MKLPKWLPKIGKVLSKVLEIAIALKGAGLLNKSGKPEQAPDIRRVK